MKKFLIVDDQADLRETLRDVIIFLQPTAQVRMAENGRECLQLTQEETPDIILLDINMPVMNGIETAKRLAAHPARTEFVIICMTGQSARPDKVAEMDELCDEFLRKPFSIDELLAVLP